ncbi:MAG: dipeptide epimerase [Bacteroidetes bacterium]|nr:dipeptide epimerase [Bacteroidota bacterium]
MSQFSLRYAPLNLPLRHTFTISRWSRDVAANVLVELEGDGIIGIGEASPNARYDESQESCMKWLSSFDTSTLKNPFDVETVLQAMERMGPGNYSAKVALEMALYDWIGKKLQVPLYDLWNAPSNVGPQTCFTVGIDKTENLPDRVAEAAAYPVLKIKLGTDRDKEIIKTIRSVTDKPIWIDANEGWKDLDTAKDHIRFLADQNVHMIEQPMPASMKKELAELKAYSPIITMADESFTGRESVEELAACFHGINLKLMKTGSLRRTMQLIHTGRNAGLKIMIGCMIESSLANTAAALISLWCDYADLDGHLLINEDPFKGLAFNESNNVFLPQRPGLGVIPR